MIGYAGQQESERVFNMSENQTRAKSTRAAGIVGIAVLCSRILGLLREAVFASLFGAGRSLDVFLVAFRTPNLLRDLFAEGALSMAFVTVFSKKIEKEGDESAWRLGCKVATLTAVFMSIVTVIGILAAPWIIWFFAPGFDAEKAAMTVLLARIMYPFILLVSLAALVMGMLNAKHVFGMPAMASSFFNLGSIIGGALFGWWIDPEFGQRATIGLAIGTLIGGFLQLVVQFPSLWKVGFRYRPDFRWNDEGVKQVLRLMGPAVVAASAVQVNVVVNQMFASHLQEGAISWLQIAFRLMQLPLGIFGVAIATVTLPMISKSVAAGKPEEFRSILASGIRLAFLLTIPAAVGLAVLADPIISVIYERGAFNRNMTLMTAQALQFYALGLVAYSGLKVLIPAFYALDRRKTPMMISFVAIGINLLANWFFTFHLGLGHRGLALSTGIVAVINFVILYELMRRAAGGLETNMLWKGMLKMALSSGVLLGVCLFGKMYLLSGWEQMGFVESVIRLFSVIGVAAAGFFVTAELVKIPEMQEVTKLVKKKLGKR